MDEPALHVTSGDALADRPEDIDPTQDLRDRELPAQVAALPAGRQP